MTAQVSAVVCTRNRAQLLELCLRSLRDQTLAPDAFEVIVLDNGSTDNTAEVASKARLENLRYVYEGRLGLSHARNRGLAEARSPYVAYIDDDARAEEHWLERILDRFNTLDPKPVSIGGPILPWYEVPKPAWFKDEYEVRTWGDQATYLDVSRRGFSGSNMTWQTCVLKELGGFDTRLGVCGKKLLLGEETLLYHRLRQTHGSQPVLFYDPAIVVYHLVPKAKLSPWYRVRRRYASGVTRVRMESLVGNGSRGAAEHALRLLRSLPRQSVGFLSDVVRAKEPWQCSLADRGGRLASLLGMTVEALRVAREEDGR